MPEHTSDPETRIAELEALLAAERSRANAERAAFESSRATLASSLAYSQERIAALERERDVLRASHERLRLELELLKRRIFIAKAERVDASQLELEFATKLRELDAIAGTLGIAGRERESGDGPRTERRRSSGRRDLRRAPIEENRVELSDPVFDQLVAEGKAERAGFELSYKLAWQRGGMRRLVIARAKYRALDSQGEACVEITPMPSETFRRSLAAPSMLAHVIMQKHGDGMPLFRLEDRFAREGVPIDRGTMCRWLEDAGATLGSTLVHAMRDEAMRTAFCIATDATGVLVQPIRTHEKRRQSCRRGHFFVQIADRDHVFFEYTPRETSKVVGSMFRGFSGYIQADAKSVYDALFRDPNEKPPDADTGERHEVGCWSHARRKFWEAAIAKSAVAREGLARIARIFELDATWRSKAPAEIARLRAEHLRPHVESFFVWAEAEYDNVRHERGYLRDAVGYATRQRHALVRFLEDGRLPMDNNRSERELRRIAVGRKAWLFVGSDDHAESAGHLFTMIASARLHGLDPEAYLRDVLRVLAHWPRERYLELAPKYWAATRARLVPGQLADEIGEIDVPDREPSSEPRES